MQYTIQVGGKGEVMALYVAFKDIVNNRYYCEVFREIPNKLYHVKVYQKGKKSYTRKFSSYEMARDFVDEIREANK